MTWDASKEAVESLLQTFLGTQLEWGTLLGEDTGPSSKRRFMQGDGKGSRSSEANAAKGSQAGLGNSQPAKTDSTGAVGEAGVSSRGDMDDSFGESISPNGSTSSIETVGCGRVGWACRAQTRVWDSSEISNKSHFGPARRSWCSCAKRSSVVSNWGLKSVVPEGAVLTRLNCVAGCFVARR
jgi:hypothetical protein